MKSKTPHKLDRYDRQILALLQADAGLTNQQLAEQVGLSASPCLRRVKALEDAGIIVSRHTRLNQKALGLDLTVIIQISMDRHTPERFEAFERTVSSYPQVQQCYLITGQDADYLLKVVARIEGVSGVHSSFVMRKVVDTTALPLDYVKDRA